MSARICVAAMLLIAACSSDDGGTQADETTSPDDSSTTSLPAAGDLTIVNLNVLHGLFLGDACPAETNGCEAETRLGFVFDFVEEAGCPDVITLQEVGPQQQELIPAGLLDLCGGAYELVSERPGLPVEQWILSSLPVVRAVSQPISGISRSAQLVTLDSGIGPVDVITTHFVASIDNLPCTDELCTDLCEPDQLAGDCNPQEILAFVEAETDPTTPTVLTGDLNARPTEARITRLTDAGFVDAVIAAGNAECGENATENCTSGISGPGPFDGLDRADRTFGGRIDYILVLAPESCSLDFDGRGDVDDDGTSTGPWADQPAPEAVNGVFWASDHGGVQADLTCG